VRDVSDRRRVARAPDASASGRKRRFCTHCAAVIIAVQILHERWTDWCELLPDPNRNRRVIAASDSGGFNMMAAILPVYTFADMVSALVSDPRHHQLPGLFRPDPKKLKFSEFADSDVERVRGAPRRRGRGGARRAASRGRGREARGRGRGRGAGRGGVRLAAGDRSHSGDDSDASADDSDSDSIDNDSPPPPPPQPIIARPQQRASSELRQLESDARSHPHAPRATRQRKRREILDI